MLDIQVKENGDIFLSGRFDASQVEKAKTVLDTINDACTLDFEGLDYISSAGLGELLFVQKRLMDKGKGLRLINLNKYITDVFTYAGFHSVFKIE